MANLFFITILLERPSVNRFGLPNLDKFHYGYSNSKRFFYTNKSILNFLTHILVVISFISKVIFIKKNKMLFKLYVSKSTYNYLFRWRKKMPTMLYIFMYGHIYEVSNEKKKKTFKPCMKRNLKIKQETCFYNLDTIRVECFTLEYSMHSENTVVRAYCGAPLKHFV